MSSTDISAERLAVALFGSDAFALGLAGLALTRDLLLRPART
jgi:hypothetical protein